MALGKMLMAVTLMAMVTIFIPFFVATMGAVDSGVDMTGSDYEDQYDAATASSQVTIDVVQHIPYILAVGCLILSLLWVGKQKKF